MNRSSHARPCPIHSNDRFERARIRVAPTSWMSEKLRRRRGPFFALLKPIRIATKPSATAVSTHRIAYCEKAISGAQKEEN